MLYTTKMIEQIKGFIFSVVQILKLRIFSKSASEEESTFSSKIGAEKVVNHSPKFRHSFISALSQISISSIPDFLNFQEQSYPENRSFLIFLDEVISEFPELFEPNRINAVKKWLEGKEKILMEPVGTVFHFSENISDNRQDILLAWDTFEKDIDIQKHFRKKYIKKKVWYDYHKAKGDIEKAQRALSSMELDKIFLSEEFESSVQRIESKPFDVFPLAILFVEKVNFIATNNTECFNPISQKAQAFLERRSAHLHKSIKEGNLEAMSSFYNDWVGEPLKSTDPHFTFFFAYAMRQIPRKQLRAFLNSQLGFYQQPFRMLLEDTLEDFEHLFEPRCKAFIQQWIHENERTLTIQANRAADGDSQSAKEGFIKIKGNLTHEQVTEAFHAFFNRTDLNKGQPFLTESDVSALCKIGLAYPKEEPLTKLIQLQISSGCKDKFFGLIYELYDQNMNSRTKSGSKEDFARFLKYNFTGFEAQSIKRIANNIRRPRGPRR